MDRRYAFPPGHTARSHGSTGLWQTGHIHLLARRLNSRYVARSYGLRCSQPLPRQGCLMRPHKSGHLIETLSSVTQQSSPSSPMSLATTAMLHSRGMRAVSVMRFTASSRQRSLIYIHTYVSTHASNVSVRHTCTPPLHRLHASFLTHACIG